MYRRKIFLIALLLLPLTQILAADTEIIHQEKSVYRDIFVRRIKDNICLSFSQKDTDALQSCINVTNPDELVFPTIRMVFAALLLDPTPQRILIVGLGGGSLPRALSTLFRNARIEISEIDPAMVRVAKNYFQFSEHDRMIVTIGDGRLYIKRALLTGETYDLIILDAFNGSYIPEHLMTQEFLSETNALLSPGGVLAANTFAVSQLYDHESATYREVFGEFFNMKLKGWANRVIITRKFDPQSQNRLPDTATLSQRAKDLEHNLEPLGINIRSFPGLMSREIDWNAEAVPLTDQYSPANLLKAVPDGSDIRKYMEVYGPYQ